MSADQWEQLRRGIDCPFDSRKADAADNWDLVSRLSASSLYLTKNQTYRGHCVLVLDLRHAVRPDQLSAAEWAAFCAKVLGQPKLAADSRYDSNSKRNQRRGEILSIIDKVFSTLTTEQLIEKLDAAGIANARLISGPGGVLYGPRSPRSGQPPTPPR